jgi:hypothetical protein
MPFTLQVHQFRRGRNNQRVLAKEVPYKAFSNGDQRLYVQDGHVYSESGVLEENPPGWFWSAYAQTTPEKKKILGLIEPGTKGKAKADT